MHEYQDCGECRNEAYLPWLTAYDIEHYLADRWNVSTDLMILLGDKSVAPSERGILKLNVLDLIEGEHAI
jgi:hypothetical protein